uniref:Reverse transcriptase Ty1/copia-type domain-containing protein n=2 Tax=Physcomitrium patens TaxID=3218 RepID=A0A7I4DBX5_PHYPA
MAIVVSELMWLQLLLHNLHCAKTLKTPTLVYCDNQSALALKWRRIIVIELRTVEKHSHFVKIYLRGALTRSNVLVARTVDLTYLGILKAVGVKSFYDCEMFSQKKRFQYQNSLTALEKVCRCAEEQDEHYTTTTISVHVFGKDSR